MTRAFFRRKQGPQGEKAIKIPRSTGTGASIRLKLCQRRSLGSTNVTSTQNSWNRNSTQAGELPHGPKAGQEATSTKPSTMAAFWMATTIADGAALLHAGGDDVHHGFHAALGGYQGVGPGDLLLGQLLVLLAQAAVQNAHEAVSMPNSRETSWVVTLGSVVRTMTLMPLSSRRWSSFFRRGGRRRR